MVSLGNHCGISLRLRVLWLHEFYMLPQHNKAIDVVDIDGVGESGFLSVVKKDRFVSVTKKAQRNR